MAQWKKACLAHNKKLSLQALDLGRDAVELEDFLKQNKTQKSKTQKKQNKQRKLRNRLESWPSKLGYMRSYVGPGIPSTRETPALGDPMC